MFFSKYTVAASALVSGAFAKTIPITVGDNKELAFSPNTVTAAVGDVLEFSFFPANHTVTSGSFATPCQVGATTDAFFSGFMPTTTESNMTFSVTVNNTTPLWIFCSQAKHCQAGMSMVVNQAATGNKTLDAYQTAAKLIAKTDIPTDVTGGVFAAANSSGSSTSSGSSSTTTSAASASSTSNAAGNVVVSPLNMVAAGAAAIGAFAFSIAL